MTSVTGALKLSRRLILRRDRWLLLIWLIFALIPLSFVNAIDKLDPTAADRAKYAGSVQTNSMFTALYGRLYGSSLGELVAWRAGFVPVVLGLVSILTVIRHTRTEEENGRRELLGSTVVGRQATLAAALFMTFVFNIVVALLLAGAMSGKKLGGGSALAFGLQFAMVGIVFAAVAGLAAQLTSRAATARSIAIVVLVVALLLRIVGNVQDQSGGALAWVTWLSPLGWANEIRPYTSDRWWVLILGVLLTAVLCVVAGRMSARRDLGAGLLPDRPGPAEGGAGLASPLGLAWRLHRGLLLGWTAGFVVLGIVLGSLGTAIGDTMKDNHGVQDFFTRMGGRSGLIDAYLAGMLSILAFVAAAYAIQAALRLRAEESGMRAEPVLATGVGRLKWAASQLVFALLGPAVAMFAAGLAMGISYGLDDHDVGKQLPRVLGAAMLQLPAVWVLGAIAVLLFGLLPRLSVGSWVVLGVCVLLGQVGAVLQLNQGLLDVSPFTHIPKAPGGTISAMPLVWLVVVAVVLSVVGLLGLRRRDIPVG